MGRLITFYTEPNFWLCGYTEQFQKVLFAERNYVLASATFHITGAKGKAGGWR